MINSFQVFKLTKKSVSIFQKLLLTQFGVFPRPTLNKEAIILLQPIPEINSSVIKEVSDLLKDKSLSVAEKIKKFEKMLKVSMPIVDSRYIHKAFEAFEKREKTKLLKNPPKII